jgi:hypothetical protein
MSGQPYEQDASSYLSLGDTWIAVFSAMAAVAAIGVSMSILSEEAEFGALSFVGPLALSDILCIAESSVETLPAFESGLSEACASSSERMAGERSREGKGGGSGL